jgi:hypothetical protein
VAGQFHPEFRSRPIRPHPLFRDFVGAATALADRRDAEGGRSAGRHQASGGQDAPGRRNGVAAGASSQADHAGEGLASSGAGIDLADGGPRPAAGERHPAGGEPPGGAGERPAGSVERAEGDESMLVGPGKPRTRDAERR